MTSRVHQDELGVPQGPVPEHNIRVWVEQGFLKGPSCLMRHENYPHFIAMNDQELGDLADAWLAAVNARGGPLLPPVRQEKDAVALLLEAKTAPETKVEVDAKPGGVEFPMWYFRDPNAARLSQAERGPVSSKHLLEQVEKGFLSAATLIKRKEDAEFKAMGPAAEFPEAWLRGVDPGICWYFKDGSGAIRGPVMVDEIERCDANVLVRHSDDKLFLPRGPVGASSSSPSSGESKNGTVGGAATGGKPFDPVEWQGRAAKLRGQSGALHAAFLKYDVDGSCSIDFSEMQALLEDLQFPIKITKAKFNEYDTDGSGELEYEEFVEFMGSAAPDVFKAGMWYYHDDDGLEQ